jgi:hypothetical protein
MIDYAIRKSENAIGRVVVTLVLCAIAMLGFVWLSIAAAAGLALVLPPAVAAAITGAVIVVIAFVAYGITHKGSESEEKSEASDSRSSAAGDDLTARAMLIAERMAPDSPLAAVVFALLTGLGAVGMPAAFTPFLNKILDDIEKTPGGRKGPDHMNGRGG